MILLFVGSLKLAKAINIAEVGRYRRFYPWSFRNHQSASLSTQKIKDKKGELL